MKQSGDALIALMNVWLGRIVESVLTSIRSVLIKVRRTDRTTNISTTALALVRKGVLACHVKTPTTYGRTHTSVRYQAEWNQIIRQRLVRRGESILSPPPTHYFRVPKLET